MHEQSHSSIDIEKLWQGDTNTKKIPVWLDCDTGHDDAFAILVAALTPRINLLGISTVYGNAPVDSTTSNTLSILTAIQCPSIPVYSGASKPFCREPCFAPDIHGVTGLDGTTCLPSPDCSVHHGNAVQAMYEAISKQPKGEVYIVATAALTNIALFFSIYPEMTDHVKGVNIMGGAVGGGFTNAPMGTINADAPPPTETKTDAIEARFGNWTPFAEFNIYCDPEAAKAVLENVRLMGKLLLVPLDLSHLFLATEEVQDGLLWGFGGQKDRIDGPKAVRKLFHEILTFFAHSYAEIFGIVDGPPLHDVLPMLAVLVPEIFDDRGKERYSVNVVIDGSHGTEGIARTTSQVGRTVCTQIESGQMGIRIPRDLNKKIAWQLIDRCMSSL